MKKHAKHEGMISDNYVLQKFVSLVVIVIKKTMKKSMTSHLGLPQMEQKCQI